MSKIRQSFHFCTPRKAQNFRNAPNLKYIFLSRLIELRSAFYLFRNLRQFVKSPLYPYMVRPFMFIKQFFSMKIKTPQIDQFGDFVKFQIFFSQPSYVAKV